MPASSLIPIRRIRFGAVSVSGAVVVIIRNLGP